MLTKACWLLLGLASEAGAMTILEAYTLALAHAPAWQAALKEKEAGDEEENIALAGLLPEVSASYQNSRYNWQKQELVQSGAGGPRKVANHTDYSGYSGSVTLTQPLFDYQAITRYRAGQAQKLMAHEKYRSRLQDLASSVTEAYLQLACRQEYIKLAGLKKRAFFEQLRLSRRLLQAGEGSATDVAESEARYTLALAEEIEVNNDFDEARRRLETVIGLPLKAVRLPALPLNERQPLPLKAQGFEEWQSLLLTNNPSLQATRQELEAKRYQVEQYRAGHFPVVQLYASHSVNDSANDNTVHQKYRTSSLGLRVKVPLYSGGGVAASTRKAAAEYSQSKYLLAEKTASTLNELKNYYNRYHSSRAKIHALTLALEAARKQHVATRKSVFAGQRINLDILNAEQQLYNAQLELINERVNHIKSWLGLLNRSGVLEIKDLVVLDGHFSQK